MEISNFRQTSRTVPNLTEPNRIESKRTRIEGRTESERNSKPNFVFLIVSLMLISNLYFFRIRFGFDSVKKFDLVRSDSVRIGSVRFGSNSVSFDENSIFP